MWGLKSFFLILKVFYRTKKNNFSTVQLWTFFSLYGFLCVKSKNVFCFLIGCIIFILIQFNVFPPPPWDFLFDTWIVWWCVVSFPNVWTFFCYLSHFLVWFQCDLRTHFVGFEFLYTCWGLFTGPSYGSVSVSFTWALEKNVRSVLSRMFCHVK